MSITRNCGVCDEARDIKIVGERRYVLKLRDGTDFIFHHIDAICNSCGFLFSRVVPCEEELLRYYLNYPGCAENFDTAARISKIREYADRGSRIKCVSEGDNFNGAMTDAGFIIADTDLDIITYYYILEHVVDFKSMIVDDITKLRDGGYVIIEVPDFMGFPTAALYPEHLNYFTIHHLLMAMRSLGFSHIESIRAHSRPFGFAAIFQYFKGNPIAQIISSNYIRFKAPSYTINGVTYSNRAENL